MDKNKTTNKMNNKICGQIRLNKFQEQNKKRQVKSEQGKDLKQVANRIRIYRLNKNKRRIKTKQKPKQNDIWQLKQK